MICIGASDLRVIGRNTQGVRLVNLKEGDKLVSAAVLEPDEEVEEAVDGETPETIETPMEKTSEESAE
jgi:DNA gyrase subunit A